MNILVTVGLLITLLTFIPVGLQLRNHPRGLILLFFVEMWERFSYAGMRGLLIFFLTEHFLFSDKMAQSQYGAYNALAYLTPLIGGFLADRFLGARRAVAFGAALLVLGHLLMAFEGRPAVQILTYQGQSHELQVQGHETVLVADGRRLHYRLAANGDIALQRGDARLPGLIKRSEYELTTRPVAPLFEYMLYLALALIATGVGFLKPNIAALVGQLYPRGDPRTDAGFTLYYYGINLGSFWAAIVCGWLGQTFGWSFGFGAAGIGMAIGFVAFLMGGAVLGDAGAPPAPERLRKRLLGPVTFEWSLYAAGLLVALSCWLLMPSGLVGPLLAISSACLLAYLVFMVATQCTKAERDRMLLAFALVGGAIIFSVVRDQAGLSMNQFAERNTDLSIGWGQRITAAQTQSFNPGFILILAPLFALAWARLARAKAEPSAPVKSGLGLVQAGAGFLLLAWGAHLADAHYQTPLIFLVLAYFLHTTAELFLWTLGLSQMSKLAPAKLVSTMMATWYLAAAWAHWIGARIAHLTAADTVAGQVVDPAGALAAYVRLFENLGYASLVSGLAMTLFARPLDRLRHAEG